MKISKTNKILIAIIVIILLLAGYAFRTRTKQKSYDYTDPIKHGSIMDSVYGIGTVMARKTYQIKSGLTNIIRKIHVREGDFVEKGTRLIDLDSTSFFAPFSGTVTWIPVKEGELALTQASLLTLVDLSDRYLIVSLDQRGALKVKQGQKAKISFDSYREEVFEGIVESIYSNDNNFLVRIDVSNLPSQILPGMTADVAIGIAELKNVLVVPTAAINNGHVLVLQENGKLKSVPISIGIVDGVMAQVISDELKDGQRLAIQKKVK